MQFITVIVLISSYTESLQNAVIPTKFYKNMFWTRASVHQPKFVTKKPKYNNDELCGPVPFPELNYEDLAGFTVDVCSPYTGDPKNIILRSEHELKCKSKTLVAQSSDYDEKMFPLTSRKLKSTATLIWKLSTKKLMNRIIPYDLLQSAISKFESNLKNPPRSEMMLVRDATPEPGFTLDFISERGINSEYVHKSELVTMPVHDMGVNQELTTESEEPLECLFATLPPTLRELDDINSLRAIIESIKPAINRPNSKLGVNNEKLGLRPHVKPDDVTTPKTSTNINPQAMYENGIGVPKPQIKIQPHGIVEMKPVVPQQQNKLQPHAMPESGSDVPKPDIKLKPHAAVLEVDIGISKPQVKVQPHVISDIVIDVPKPQIKLQPLALLVGIPKPQLELQPPEISGVEVVVPTPKIRHRLQKITEFDIKYGLSAKFKTPQTTTTASKSDNSISHVEVLKTSKKYCTGNDADCGITIWQ